MSALIRPSITALLRRDYPSQTFGAFAAIFAILAVVVGTAMLRVDPPKPDEAAIFGGCFGLFALGTGFVFVRRLRWIVGLTRRGVVVDGTVLRSDTNSEDIWYLAVGYDFDGRSYHFTQGTGSKSRFTAGDVVRILVDPQRPDKAWLTESLGPAVDASAGTH